MKRLYLHRLDSREVDFDPLAHQKQYGTMVVDGFPIVTIERPWIPCPDRIDHLNLGKPGYSCICPGEFLLIRGKSGSESVRTGQEILRWYLVDESIGLYRHQAQCSESWQRWGVKFHPANWARQLHGCIAPGVNIQQFSGEGYGVASSNNSQRIVDRYLEGEDEARLIIS